MRAMFFLFLASIAFAGTLENSSAQAEADCPGPTFECVPTETGPKVPAPPPGPIFKPANPTVKNRTDFNKKYRPIKDGKIIILKETPELPDAMNDYLQSNREYIDPNALDMLAPGSVKMQDLDADRLITRDGAITR